MNKMIDVSHNKAIQKLLCPLSLLALLATPALAQDTDPQNQVVEGYLACMSGGGQLDLTQAMLDALQWTQSDDGEEGLTYFFPGAGEDTFLYIADDGSFCHVESLTVDSATASEILAATLGGRSEPMVGDKIPGSSAIVKVVQGKGGKP